MCACVCDSEVKKKGVGKGTGTQEEVSHPDELSQFGCPVNLSLGKEWAVGSLVGHKRHPPGQQTAPDS